MQNQRDYGRIISLGVLFVAIDSGMAGMIRADGGPKYSMAGLLAGCITNIILDPIFTQAAIVVVMAVTNNILVSYGAKSVYGAEIPLTTIGITMKVNQIISAITIGLATGAKPIFGYNYGSGQKERVKQTYKIVLVSATVVLVLAFFIFQFAPMSIVRLFGAESDLYN